MFEFDKSTKNLYLRDSDFADSPLILKVGQVYIDIADSEPQQMPWYPSARLRKIVNNDHVKSTLSLYFLSVDNNCKNPSYVNNNLIYLGSIFSGIEIKTSNNGFLFRHTKDNIMLFFLSGEEVIFTLGYYRPEVNEVFAYYKNIKLWPINEKYVDRTVYR